MSVKVSLETYACVTWEIPEFFRLPDWSNYFIESPQFHLTDNPYCLRLYTSIWKNVNGQWHWFVAFDLLRIPSHVSEEHAPYKIGCKSITGKELSAECKEHFDGTDIKFLYFVNRSILEEQKDTYVPEGTLTVFCRKRLGESLNSSSLQSEVGETAIAERTLASHQDGDYGVLPSIGKLQADYEHLLLKRTESDLCVVVCGREFQVHRNILRARSPVFDAMFDHETEEKKSGRVVIDDLDPESFSEFLEYVYTGRVKAFSNDNAFRVYVAADKYQLPTLKSECVEYMKKNLTVDSFCDFMNLALLYNEMDLGEQAVVFFKKNLPRIISTLKWQQFMIENSTRVNELLLKAFAPTE